MRRSGILICLCHFVFVLAWQCEITQANAPTTKRVPVVAIDDTAALKAHEGDEVVVSGIVSRAGESKTGAIVFINFEGVEAGGFSAVVSVEDLPEIERVVGANLDAALPDRKISVTGRISMYSGEPQIQIKTAKQIKVSR